MPSEEEKEHAKEYMESMTCLKQRNGFLLTDVTKFAISQKPGIHSEM